MAGLQNIKDQSPRIATLRPHHRLRHRGHAAHETVPEDTPARSQSHGEELAAFCFLLLLNTSEV